jgi:hypothetical protein
MHETHFQSQFTAAALLEFALRFLQKWSKTPWITEHTQGITVGFRAGLAFFATLGITWKYDNHVLVIGGLSLLAITTALWHFAGQYATQHVLGGMLRSGNLDKIKAIVQAAVGEAIAEQAAPALVVGAPSPGGIPQIKPGG